LILQLIAKLVANNVTPNLKEILKTLDVNILKDLSKNIMENNIEIENKSNLKKGGNPRPVDKRRRHRKKRKGMDFRFSSRPP
jgi:hypothetical protein